MRITWKDVFNTNHKWYPNIENASLAAQNAGYEYFSWNGWVYSSKLKDIESTVCLVAELE